MEKTCPNCHNIFIDKAYKYSTARTYCGRKCSAEVSQNGRKMLGKKNPKITAEKHYLWKGDKVGYVSLHQWVRHRIKSPKVCPDCNEYKKLDLANLDHKYTRDLGTWGYKCRSCHRKYDNILNGKSIGHRTYCAKGHEYSEDNIAYHKSTGYVYCKTCNRMRNMRKLTLKR